MKLQFKKLDEKAKVPQKAHATDAGFDLVATGRAIRQHYIQYSTGIAVNIPEGHVGLLFPRSSVSDKPLTLANCVGVIDAKYQGEILLRFRKSASASLHANNEQEMYKVGERVGQLVILELPQVELEEVESFSGVSERGEGGFGSTGLEELKEELAKVTKKKTKKKDSSKEEKVISE